jgi:hypothetical protein
MIDINTHSHAEVERQLRSVLSPDQFLFVEPLLDHDHEPPAGNRPFVQLAYDDIDPAFLDLALGYADIAKTGGAVGLDGSFSPVRQGLEFVVFPLSGFEKHLEQNLETMVSALRAQGEPTRFLTAHHQYPSAEELLVAGLLACILFARQHHQALCVRW